jgi:hypothetical protein
MGPKHYHLTGRGDKTNDILHLNKPSHWDGSSAVGIRRNGIEDDIPRCNSQISIREKAFILLGNKLNKHFEQDERT